MPLAWDNCEILCDEPDCPSYVPERYGPKGVHTYPVACLYRSSASALHVVGETFHLGNIRGHAVEFPFGWCERILHDETRVRWVSPDGRERSFSESTVYDNARLARALRCVTHASEVRDVPESELLEAPAIHHGQLVRLSSTWSFGFERSAIAGAWLTLAEGADVLMQTIERRVSVSGLWLCQPRKVYGHLGGYRAEMLAYTLER